MMGGKFNYRAIDEGSFIQSPLLDIYAWLTECCLSFNNNIICFTLNIGTMSVVNNFLLNYLTKCITINNYF